MIAAICYGLPVHKSPKLIASAYPKYTLPPPAFREDRQCDLMCRGIALAWSGAAKGRSYSFHLYDQSVTAITDIWAVSLQDRPQPGFRSPGRRWLCRAVAPQ